MPISNHKNLYRLFENLVAGILILFIPLTATGTTNNITYTDPAAKEITIDKLEDLYYLRVSRSVRLTGENFIDFNNFNCIARVRTYTTIKIEF